MPKVIKDIEGPAGISKIPIDVIFEISPLEVRINKDLPRWRKEMGDVRDLAESIINKGQIHPILLDQNNNLVCGGRRLAACITAGIKVKAAYTDKVDPIILRELELEENLRRKNFTVGEEVLAVKELHDLKVRQHGEATSGRTGGWTLEQTAALVGKTKGSVIADIQMARAVQQFPELKNAKKKNAITKAIKGLETLQANIAGIAAHKEAIADKKDLFDIYNGDSVEYMAKMKDGSIDILFTDPMYGISADKTVLGIGGVTGGLTVAGFAIDDSEDPALAFLKKLATESFRICNEKASGYIFVAPEFFNFVRDIFTHAGWSVYPKPIIWLKGATGQCNQPSMWPSSCYEMVIFVRKKSARLVIEGKPDWVECQVVNHTVKIHPYEKPVTLIQELLGRIAYPGKTLYDPCMGSGAIIEAAVKMKLFAIGGDRSTEAYSQAAARLAKMTVKEETG